MVSAVDPRRSQQVVFPTHGTLFVCQSRYMATVPGGPGDLGQDETRFNRKL